MIKMLVFKCAPKIALIRNIDTTVIGKSICMIISFRDNYRLYITHVNDNTDVYNTSGTYRNRVKGLLKKYKGDIIKNKYRITSKGDLINKSTKS